MSVSAPAPSNTPPPDIASLRQLPCQDPTGRLAISPKRPARDLPLRVLSLHGDADTAIAVVGPTARPQDPVLLDVEHRTGPPTSVFARTVPTSAGTHRILLLKHGRPEACTEVEVEDARTTSAAPRNARTAWIADANWDGRNEDLFSAWIEKLFDAPIGKSPSYAALHEVTQDETRNFLFDHLGLDEDAPLPRGLRLDPDCADLPYFLRAYFAWKLQLPFAFSSCTRGFGQTPPVCRSHKSHGVPLETAVAHPVRRMERFLRTTLKDTAHSGTGRTRADDDRTDYYPIELSAKTLRPGTIYADPYGHILIVSKLVPQTDAAAGILFAVDGQPDGTVARKRFWEGNFLFSLAEPAMGSPGFKRFRPFITAGAAATPVSNAELATLPGYGDYGLNQYAKDGPAFYDSVADILSPNPLAPERAMLEKIQALEEQVRTRVGSVDNGEARFRRDTSEIEMPDGSAIFETTGDWENFSTPSRDLRLLIAIDVVLQFPSRVKARPTRFQVEASQSIDEIVAALDAKLQAELQNRKVSYTRSDGSAWTLSLFDVVSRASDLEIAFNPNDCSEVRWGAPVQSEESKTCRRRASGAQRSKMATMRHWFKKRERPPRGS